MLRTLIEKNRSYRRFNESVAIPLAELEEIASTLAICPSGANLQPLKLILSADARRNSEIFPALRWAGYLKDWHGPEKGERPTGYIIILGDTSISRNFGFDPGIAAQTMMLAAVEKGYGGCMIGALDKEALMSLYELDERYQVQLVLALGVPVETVKIEPMPADGSVKYWRDENRVHHVPKRTMKELVLVKE